ncbi:unnamed protein product [Urochloa humidicola]
MGNLVPEELIGDNLLRLPAAAVLRFRAVCKQWRALVDDPCFSIAHHRRRPAMPLHCLRRDDPPTTTIIPRHFRVRLDAIDLRCAGATQPVIHFTAPARDEGDFQVYGSCDGVLLVSYKGSDYLCNPARRRWARVPALTSAAIVGFYAHRPSGDFHVLHRSGRCTTGIDDYRILTLSRPATFRRISGGPHSDELLAAIRLRPASEAPPAIVSGNLHWLPAGASTDLILVFDTVSETFRLMQRPHGQAQVLLELDGKLTMTITHLATAELWVLQDYERPDSWACKLRIPLPPAPADTDIIPGAVAIVSPEGDVMVQCTNSLLQCDAMGRVRMRHQPEHHRIIAVPHMFRESLVPHGHVDGREIITGYGGIRYPPFFIDCNCHLHTELSQDCNSWQYD